MKINILSSLRKIVLPAILCVSVVSCKNTFDIEPQDALEHSQMYRNVYDADAAIVGIYGKFLGLAKQYIVLNELRGDLMDVTQNSDDDLREINEHDVKEGNVYASPRAFYEVIINCNDVLANFDKMLAEKRMTKLEYDQRYSDVGALRSWLYLQVGIHWGNVPYVTDPLANISDITDESKFPKLSFDQLLEKLVNFTEALPWKDFYQPGTSLLNSSDGYPTAKFFVVKRLVLGDLNLWQGNSSAAAMHYRAILDFSQSLADRGEDYYGYYKVAWGNLTGSGWERIFYERFNDRYQNMENIWMLPFERTIPRPANPFIEMFSAKKGYLLKPSALAISNWENESNSNSNILGDVVRLNGSVDYAPNVGDYEITKFFLGNKSFEVNPLETTGKWILYRAGQLHLRYAEAANLDGRYQLAYAMLNIGITDIFDYNPSQAGNSSEPRNVTYLQQSDKSVASPYYIDARFGNNPGFRGSWYRHIGLRNRASLAVVPIDSAKYFDMNTPVKVTFSPTGVPLDVQYRKLKDAAAGDSLKLYLEDKILKEGALELAFEGARWPDLLRIALRRKTSDPDFLADKIAAKFAAANSALEGSVRTKLQSEAGWYLPFK